MSKDGVTVAGLKEFVDKIGGRDAVKSMTTTEVCNTRLKPMTEGDEVSYCALMRDLGNPHVKPATVFISHAWKYDFLRVVDAILKHFEDEPEAVIWFDLFSNNQHKAVDLDFHWWSTTFRTAIEDFGRVVVVLMPWNDPIPFTRAWCLFEMYTTISTGSKLEVALDGAERETFLKEICKDGTKF